MKIISLGMAVFSWMVAALNLWHFGLDATWPETGFIILLCMIGAAEYDWYHREFQS